MIINNTITIDNYSDSIGNRINITFLRGVDVTLQFDSVVEERDINNQIIVLPTSFGGNICAVFTLDFISSFGGTRPSFRYNPNKKSIINYTLGSSVPSLYNFTLTPNRTEEQGDRLELSFTPLGTTPYSTEIMMERHPLGSALGRRFDSYGLPFVSAKYELRLKLDNGSIIRPIYGDIEIVSRYAGNDTDNICF
jgi:hypothetical protein